MKARKTFSKIIFMLFCVGMTFLFVACTKEKHEKNYKNYIMTVDRSEYTLIKKEFKMPSEDSLEQVESLISSLSSRKSKDEISPIQGEEMVRSWELVDGVLRIYFTSDYYDIPTVNEAICRAAVVQTLCQVDGVEFVEFYVDEATLTIDGRVIGSMNSDYFVGGLSDAEASVRLTLYFPDKNFKGLVKVEREVNINTSSTDEESIMKQLIAGPKADEDGVSCIPEGTHIKTIVTKDMICYVTLSQEFLKYLSDVPDNLTVYSIVNTLCNLGGINSVVLMVDGSDTEFYNSFNIKDSLTYNHDIVLDIEE